MTVLKYVLIICIVMFAVCFLACGYAYNQIAWRKTFKLPTFLKRLIAGNEQEGEYEVFCEKMRDEYNKYPLEKITLTLSKKEYLNAHLLVPPNPNGKIILASHGARSDGIGEFCKIGPYFYSKGYIVMMPDHRGCADSCGKYMGYGTHESKDTYLWVEYLKKRFPKQVIFLYGISMGAATVLMMSDNAEDEAIRGIISDCSYTSAWDEFSYQLKMSFHLPEFPVLYICDFYSKIFAGYSFKDAYPYEHVKKAKKPILFIHGRADDYVPYYMMDILYKACPNEKYKVTIDNALHARSYYQDNIKYEKEIEKFIEKCMSNENLIRKNNEG